MFNQPQPLALYIHWPFCLAKCPYCDFNSHVREAVDVQRWHAALLQELAWVAEQIGANWQLKSIFFGGGTPSLMPSETVAALIECARNTWICDDEIEITLEANPTSSEAGKFRAFRAAGINRLSLGIQSLRPDALAFLGREHSVAEAMNAIAMAADIFPRYSFDLIYARPNQTLQEWERELTEALKFTRGHISLYQLTMEQGTAFYPRYKRGEIILPHEEMAVALYNQTRDICAEYALHPYEVSNYAIVGEASKHNLCYWQGDAYAGIGPGAHGRIRTQNEEWIATQTYKSPERWLEHVEKHQHGMECYDELTALERAEELILTGLRLHEGIDKSIALQQTGMAIDSVLNHKNVSMLEREGLLINTAHTLKLTHEGTLLLNSVLNAILSVE